MKLKAFIIKDDWTDAGTFESLYKSNKNVYDKKRKRKVKRNNKLF